MEFHLLLLLVTVTATVAWTDVSSGLRTHNSPRTKSKAARTVYTCDESELSPHPNDCRKYYECIKGHLMLRTCPGIDEFSPVYKWCLPPKLAKCGNRDATTENPCRTTTSTAETSPSTVTVSSTTSNEPTTERGSTTLAPFPTNDGPTDEPSPTSEGPTDGPSPTSEGSTDEPEPTSEGPTDEPSSTSEGPTEEPSPTSDGPTDEPAPTSEGPTDEPSPTSEGPTDVPSPTSEGPTDEPSPTSEGPTDEPFPTSEGPTDKPSPTSEGPTDEPSPTSEGPTDEPSPTREVPTDEPSPTSEGPTDEPSPTSEGPTDEPYPTSKGPTDAPSSTSEGPTDEPSPTSEGSTDEPSPTTEGPTDEPFPTSEGPTDAPSSTSEGPTDEPSPTSEGPTDEPSPTREGPTDDPFPTSEGPTDAPSPTSEGPTDEPSPTSESPTTLYPPTCTHGMRYPDTQDCSRYYKCFHGTAIHKRCPPKMLFSKIFSWCMPYILVICDSREIIPSIFEQIRHCVEENLNITSLKTPILTVHETESNERETYENTFQNNQDKVHWMASAVAASYEPSIAVKSDDIKSTRTPTVIVHETESDGSETNKETPTKHQDEVHSTAFAVAAPYDPSIVVKPDDIENTRTPTVTKHEAESNESETNEDILTKDQEEVHLVASAVAAPNKFSATVETHDIENTRTPTVTAHKTEANGSETNENTPTEDQNDAHWISSAVPALYEPSIEVRPDDIKNTRTPTVTVHETESDGSETKEDTPRKHQDEVHFSSTVAAPYDPSIVVKPDDIENTRSSTVTEHETESNESETNEDIPTKDQDEVHLIASAVAAPDKPSITVKTHVIENTRTPTVTAHKTESNGIETNGDTPTKYQDDAHWIASAVAAPYEPSIAVKPDDIENTRTQTVTEHETESNGSETNDDTPTKDKAEFRWRASAVAIPNEPSTTVKPHDIENARRYIHPTIDETTNSPDRVSILSSYLCRERQIYPDPSNCGKYYQCLKGVMRHESCRPGKEYSEHLRTCVSPAQANCTVSSKFKPIVYEAHSKTAKGAPHNKIAWLRSHMKDNKMPNIVMDNDSIARRRPNPDSCENYYDCFMGFCFLATCEEGQEFSPTELKCMSPEKAHCKLAVGSSKAVNEPQTTEGNDICTYTTSRPIYTLADLTDPTCRKYRLCYYGLLREKACEQDLEYSSFSNSCVDPAKSDCGHRH